MIADCDAFERENGFDLTIVVTVFSVAAPLCRLWPRVRRTRRGPGCMCATTRHSPVRTRRRRCSAAGRDPNLLRLCVEYLETTQAILPMADDTNWFADMLSALVELAVPNTTAGTRSEGLYREIEAGIAVSRSTYASDRHVDA